MKLFPDEPDFVVGEVGFDDEYAPGRKYDLLNRKTFGQKLTDLVDRFEQPLVIALDGGWGSGKSHFLKLWAGAHSKELNGKAEVIYFDAFENDYLDDPLISLVSRLIDLSEEKSWANATLDKVKKSAIPLVKGLFRIGAAVATAGISEVTGTLLDAAVTKVGEMTGDQINDFWKQETGRLGAMAQFKQALVSLTAPGGTGGLPRKIVFVIDELDRCRPDYALSMLEVIKHFFAVPNVHFVLGVNLEALKHSVSSRYGTGIDAQLYLQKFIHLSVNLPDQNNQIGRRPWEAYFRGISIEMGIRDEIYLQAIEQMKLISHSRVISLRDAQRVASRLTLLPANFRNKCEGQIIVGISAVLLLVFEPDILTDLRVGNSPWGPQPFRKIQRLFSLDSEVTGLEHFSATLKDLWAVTLDQEVGPQVDRERLSRALNGGWSGERLGFPIKSFLAENIETFHLPELPASA